jgi:hypothetical protein
MGAQGSERPKTAGSGSGQLSHSTDPDEPFVAGSVVSALPGGVASGLNPVVTFENQRPSMIGNLL